MRVRVRVRMRACVRMRECPYVFVWMVCALVDTLVNNHAYVYMYGFAWMHIRISTHACPDFQSYAYHPGAHAGIWVILQPPPRSPSA